jgi:uncharacterized protein YpuA (DUF1002 family)
MDEKENLNRLELPNDDYVVNIPKKDYHSFVRSLLKMEQAQKEFHKIKDSLNNGELKVEN